MLKNRYEAVFWGRTPWGLLHALLWRMKGREVLVIDDLKLSTASGGHRWLTQLEVQLLQELGSRHNVTPLASLDNFLRPATIKIQTPQFQWVTGSSVRDNLREFVRKFSVFQTPTLLAALESETLDNDFLKVQKAFLDWFRSPLVRHRAASNFTFTGAPWLAEFQRLFSEELLRPYQKPQDGALSQLVAAHSTVTGQVVKYAFSSYEASYLALRLLSPQWELDERWFERELSRELINSGAHIKRTRVQSWQLWDGKVEAALLDSYEGVVAHDRLLMYGLPATDGTLQCVFNSKVYRGLESFWPEDPTQSLEEAKPELVCLTASRLMGTDIPMMLLEELPKGTRLQVLVEERPGAKPEFYVNEALELARPLVSEALDWPADRWEMSQRGASWDLWVEEAVENSRTSAISLHAKRQINIIDRVDKRTLKGVQYWGPLMTERFGLLGYLTEVLWDLN
ncbi:MAG: hypothetical protein ACLGG0_01550 [Bacteriovoracia bacterium]